MPTVPTTTDPEGMAYIRGGGGVAVDTHRVIRVVAVLLLVVLAVLVVIVALEAGNQNSRMHRLRQHGVPVTVTVTSCEGVLGGTGTAASSFICQGSFTLDGQTHTEVIDGNQQNLPLGSTIRGVTIPTDPALLSTASAVAGAHADWKAFITAGILFVVLVVGLGLTVRFWRSGKGRSPRAPDTGKPVEAGDRVEAGEAVEAAATAGPPEQPVPTEPLADALPEMALRAQMAAFVAQKATELSVVAADRAPDDPDLVENLNSLLSTAIAAGTIRGDADPDDLLRALQGVWLVAGGPDRTDRAGRLLDLLIDGLRYGAPGTPAVPGPLVR
jgi:hypothetical protein